MASKYYIVYNEWNYPTESGREFRNDFDTHEEALKFCKHECEAEMNNFATVCGDALNPEYFGFGGIRDFDGYCITPKNGLDPYYFVSKIIETKRFDT